MRARAAALAAAGLCLGGGTCLGHGLYLRAKAALAEVLLERSWRETVASGHPVKAWRWADTWPVAELRFPRLQRTEIVLAQGSGEALAFAPAHLPGTALPGQRGTSVIAGHRDTHFRFVRELVLGDAIEVTSADGRTRRFRVSGFAIVSPRASGIEPGGSTRRLALVTCYPFDALGRSPLRYVVFAEASP